MVYLASLRPQYLFKIWSHENFTIVEHFPNTRVLFNQPQNIIPDGRTEVCREEEKTACLILIPVLYFLCDEKGEKLITNNSDGTTIKNADLQKVKLLNFGFYLVTLITSIFLKSSRCFFPS